MSQAMRCLVADDHPGLATAVSDFLASNGLEVIGPVGDGQRALDLAESVRPELAVVDYRMPRLSGGDLLRGLRRVAPETRVAVYTAEADENLVAEALAAGAGAIVLKEAPLQDLMRALESVLCARPYVDPALAGAIAKGRPSSPALTRRELDVLRLSAEGLSHAEMGRSLSISPETVRTHLRKACDRLNARNRTQAVAAAWRAGLFP